MLCDHFMTLEDIKDKMTNYYIIRIAKSIKKIEDVDYYFSKINPYYMSNKIFMSQVICKLMEISKRI